MSVYQGMWEESGQAGMLNDFSIDQQALVDCEVLFAKYTYEDYWGDAFVVFKKDGVLYEVNGGHCSCNGLEGQWEPETTSIEALRARTYGLAKEFVEHLDSLID